MGMKGHPQNNCGGGGSGGSAWMMKKKTAMVVVAMVVLVGVMGVMVVQRVKDRRLFNLVIKDKDRQIFSNLLLQKERQFVKENKRKNQDLNAKLFSLRTQKVELTNKIMEMRSIIGSMKDEHRVLELAIDEKQNEIKHKESEIKDLKTNLQTPPRVWSTSPGNQSNHRVNLTARGSWFGQSSNGQKPNHHEIITPDVKVQKPKDDDNAKIEMQNNINGTLATKEKWDSEENGNESKPGRRFFVGATENGQSGKSQLKANPEEGPKGEADRMDEIKALTEVDMNSRNGSEEDQDYKEETED